MASRLEPGSDLGVMDEKHPISRRMDHESAGGEVARLVLEPIEWIMSHRGQIEHLESITLLVFVRWLVGSEQTQQV